MGSPYVVKVGILGPKESGKSTLTCSLAGLPFSTESLPTVPRRPYFYGEESLDLVFWDVPRTHLLQAIEQSLHPVATAYVYVFDQSSRDSFERVQNWRMAMRPPANQPSLSILYGNPTGNSLAVSYEEAANYASSQELVYILGDAKNTEKAESVLRIIAEFVITEISHGSGD